MNFPVSTEIAKETTSLKITIQVKNPEIAGTGKIQCKSKDQDWNVHPEEKIWGTGQDLELIPPSGGGNLYTVTWKSGKSLFLMDGLAEDQLTMCDVVIQWLSGSEIQINEIACYDASGNCVLLTEPDPGRVLPSAATIEAPFETAPQAVANMQAGWNLGEALDSDIAVTDSMDPYYFEAGSAYNPAVTKRLIREVKKAGFQGIRLTVTFTQKLDINNIIDQKWLDRVEAVVNHILDEGLYCVICLQAETGSSHGGIGWSGLAWQFAVKSSYDAYKNRYTAIWKQISERFADYGGRLVFEGYSEILENFYVWKEPENDSAYEILNDWAQLFVDTVRGTGGKNAVRNLLVNTYSAYPSEKTLTNFRIPGDSAKDHLIVGVHMYEPYDFTQGKSPAASHWDKEDEETIRQQMALLNQYSQKTGVPVIIGEFAAGEQNNTSDRTEYASFLVSTAHQYGIASFWYDNGKSISKNAADATGIIQRGNCQWSYPEIRDAIIDAVAGSVDPEPEPDPNPEEKGNLTCAVAGGWELQKEGHNMRFPIATEIAKETTTLKLTIQAEDSGETSMGKIQCISNVGTKWDAVADEKMWGDGQDIEIVSTGKKNLFTVTWQSKDPIFETEALKAAHLVIQWQGGPNIQINEVACYDSGGKQILITETDPGRILPSVTTKEAPFETAQQAVAHMQAGWNLGNSLDTGEKDTGFADPYSYETGWDNPAITRGLIREVKKAGFQGIRLTVTYTQKLDANDTIAKEWLDRVETVVNYILEEDLYCIINTQCESGESKNNAIAWQFATELSYNTYKDRFASIWLQVSERFADYGGKLLFEGYNEVLDDMDSWKEPYDDSSYAILNAWAQLFVDTVRSTGGKNASRNLLVNTYGAYSSERTISNFKVPADSAKNHLIVGVHMYEPYEFTHAQSGWGLTATSQWMKASEEITRRHMGFLDKYFLKSGIPVIIGEFGSGDQNNVSDRVQYTSFLVSTAHQYGIASFLWDNGKTISKNPADAMGIIHRGNYEWAYPEIKNALIQAANMPEEPKWNAQEPVITRQPASAACVYGKRAGVLQVTASISDGGTLSYQWYRNSKNSRAGAVPIPGAVGAICVPDVTRAGTQYYYCLVSNENKKVKGIQTARTASGIAAVTVKKAPGILTVSKSNLNKTYGCNAFRVQASGQGNLTFASSAPKVAEVNAGSGKVTVKGCGKAVITVTAWGNENYEAAVCQVNLTISPKKAVLKEVKSKAAGALFLSWKKDAQATGYRIQYSKNKNFQKAKDVYVRKAKLTSRVIKKLSRGKKYYIRICVYKKAGGENIFGGWSKCVMRRVKK